MLIHLADLRWIGNGEDKRLWRHPCAGSMFESRACSDDRSLQGDGLDEVIDLSIGRRRNRFELTFRECRGHLFELHIFIDGHDRWSERLHVQLTDQLLQFWMQSSITVIGRIGDTGNLSKLLGPAYQA